LGSSSDSQANDEIKAQLTVKFWEKITKRKKILDNQLANQLKALKEKLTDLQNLISRRFWGRDEQEQKNILKEELTQIKIEIHNYLIKGADTTLTKEEASELKTLLNSTRYFCGRDSKLDEFLKNKGGTVTLKKIIGKPPIPSTPSVTDAQLKLITEALTCPISYEPLVEPVTLTSGHTYSKDRIAKWLDTSKRCPNTRAYVDKIFYTYNPLMELITAVNVESPNKEKIREIIDKLPKNPVFDKTKNEGGTQDREIKEIAESSGSQNEVSLILLKQLKEILSPP